MTRPVRIVLGVAFMALVLGGCAATDFQKEGGTAEQFANDESLCRAQVRKITAVRRDIDDARDGTFRGERERFGQTALPDTMAAMGDKSRTARTMESCMQARGWQPKSQWWQRLGS